MPSALIVGSGPAAAGAALALASQRDVTVTVLDVGTVLEDAREETVGQLSGLAPEKWDVDAVELISAQPVGTSARELPEKRSYGSNYPFRDVGQLSGISVFNDVNHHLVSSAYGGFSNIWGAQLMPFSEATLRSWPIGLAELGPHYEAMLRAVPLAGIPDDLEDRFPLFGPAQPLPPPAARTARVLEAYRANRDALNRMGIVLGSARLAFDAQQCVRCGLCMTGCPYHLIYSASRTFDALRANKRVSYHSGLLALSVEEDECSATVVARDAEGGALQRFSADRVFLACGAFGTTRLVLGSLGRYEQEATLGESVQFTLPMLSRAATSDPREEHQFTLNQFNMVIALDDAGTQLSQLHYYTYNPAFVDALPAALRRRAAAPLLSQLLRRTSVALGYLPSWASPKLHVRAHAAPQGTLTPVSVRRDAPHWARNEMLRRVLAKVTRAAPRLDLYPVLPRLVLAPGGKSYHFGGSFPHRGPNEAALAFSSDRLGRVDPWRRVHLVDASVFPNVPATTFTFTIMANAHRIAAETLEVSW